jgi:hypothetical protein
MRDLFISYARENKPAVDQLVDHLGVVGYRTWVDTSLRGGQDWWQEILSRITDCDVFVVIVSQEALNSTACGLEREWAAALGKPMLPVAIEPLSTALPKSLSTLQIVDYSDPGRRDRAALTLAGALAALPATPAPPDPIPVPPEAPLSYLTDLVDQVARPDSIDHERQRQIVSRLETALRSVDPEERRGGVDILQRFRGRGDLYADVDRALTQLADVYAGAPPVAPQKAAAASPPSRKPPVERQAPRKATLVEPAPKPKPKPRPVVPTAGTPAPMGIPALLFVVFAALSLILTGVAWFRSDVLWSLYPAWWDERWALVSKLALTVLLAVAFGLLARTMFTWTASRAAASLAAAVSAALALLTVTDLATFAATWNGDLARLPMIVALLVFVALIAFGIAAATALRRPWPLIASAAGLLGALDAILTLAEVYPPVPYYICQLWLPLLLVLGIVMMLSPPGVAESVE